MINAGLQNCAFVPSEPHHRCDFSAISLFYWAPFKLSSCLALLTPLLPVCKCITYPSVLVQATRVLVQKPLVFWELLPFFFFSGCDEALAENGGNMPPSLPSATVINALPKATYMGPVAPLLNVKSSL